LSARLPQPQATGWWSAVVVSALANPQRSDPAKVIKARPQGDLQSPQCLDSDQIP